MRLILVLAAIPLLAEDVAPNPKLTVHEWGTFTSIAGDDGDEFPWSPYSGPVDLPCFVHRLGLGPEWVKLGPALIRMETPVLYFYAPTALTVSVAVDFPKGRITEWYPRAAIFAQPGQKSRIEWNGIHVLPGAELEFPTTKGANHYYAARNTDAAPLRAGTEQERLLFYRGLGNFSVPLQPRYQDNGVLRVKNFGDDAITAILFEKRANRVGFRPFRAPKGSVEVGPLELSDDLPSLKARLESTLVEFGLYPKEAAAMLETWKDSWFEEGSRLIYIVPRPMVDTVLPIRITPEPQDLARIFVGRIELFAPERRSQLETALATGDISGAASFGRFLSPFAEMLRSRDRSFIPGSQRDLTLQSAARQIAPKAGSCVP